MLEQSADNSFFFFFLTLPYVEKQMERNAFHKPMDGTETRSFVLYVLYFVSIRELRLVFNLYSLSTMKVVKL